MHYSDEEPVNKALPTQKPVEPPTRGPLDGSSQPIVDPDPRRVPAGASAAERLAALEAVEQEIREQLWERKHPHTQPPAASADNVLDLHGGATPLDPDVANLEQGQPRTDQSGQHSPRTSLPGLFTHSFEPGQLPKPARAPGEA